MELSHKIIDWIEFRRVEPYGHNILFKLAELFSKIFSSIRRLILVIFYPIIIIIVFGIIIGLILKEHMLLDNGLSLLKTLAFVYFGGLVGPTVFFAVIGLIIRKIFRVDEKLMDELDANGYSSDLKDV